MVNTLSQKMGFSDLFCECIHDGMRYFLGESTSQAILFHLGKDLSAMSPEEYDSRLSLIFKEGAETIEKMIVKELFRRLNIPYEGESFHFEKHVDLAREAFERRANLAEATRK